MRTKKFQKEYSYDIVVKILEKDHVVLEALLLERASQGLLRGHVLSLIYEEKYQLESRILHSIYYWKWRRGGFLYSFCKYLKTAPRRVSTAPRDWLRKKLVFFLEDCWERARIYDELFVW